MSCPWTKIDTPRSDFNEIMSEEVARELQSKEEKEYRKLLDLEKQDEARPPILFDTQNFEDIPDDVLKAISNDSAESDAIIAQMLQMQYDKEHDDLLKKTEHKLNGASKVSISFENFKRVPQNFDFESDSEPEEIVDICDRKDWDRFDAVQRQIDSIPGRGYRMQQDGSFITKHDLTTNGRKNACKLLSFPPEFPTGDGEDFDLKLSDRVFNNLKKHSKKEQNRKHKIRDKKEDKATAEFGMDESTRLIIYKMESIGLLECVTGIISIGKEAVILHADGNPDYAESKRPPPRECAIKVFKTTLADFQQRYQYIGYDHRFKKKIGKHNPRKMLLNWAEKEMANLIRLERVGIKCPQVVKLKKHVLVMSFIGENNQAAPKLKDAVMEKADYIIAYDQVINTMKTLYHDANLVHADLSEYNILWFKNDCYFIDVGQAVEPCQENAFEFLFRDCGNVVKFFSKKDVPNVVSAEELFRDITGCDYNDRQAIIAIQESYKPKPHLVDKSGIESSFVFDTVWEKAKKGELPKIDSDSIEPHVEQVISNTQQLSVIDPPQA